VVNPNRSKAMKGNQNAKRNGVNRYSGENMVQNELEQQSNYRLDLNQVKRDIPGTPSADVEKHFKNLGQAVFARELAQRARSSTQAEYRNNAEKSTYPDANAAHDFFMKSYSNKILRDPKASNAQKAAVASEMLNPSSYTSDSADRDKTEYDLWRLGPAREPAPPPRDASHLEPTAKNIKKTKK
jgi:hypothetical protein